MHFHRDLLAVCDSYSRHVLRPEPDDRFIGSPPLAFTFGLGGSVLFPMRVGASAVLLEKAAPDQPLDALEAHRPTDRKSGGEGKGGSVRVNPGGRRCNKK